jgi:hypothetical protein
LKKIISGILAIGIVVTTLTACGTAKPSDTVNNFANALKAGDYNKAASFIDKTSATKDTDFSKLDKNDPNGLNGKEIFDALSKKYKFENVKDVSQKDDTAKVSVKVTGLDFGNIIMKTMGQVMPMALASAFSNNSDQKAMDKLMDSELKTNLNDKNASTVTQNITLDLKKEKDGSWKIESDKSLMETVLPNADEVSKAFGGK